MHKVLKITKKCAIITWIKKKGGKKPSAVKPDGKSVAATEKNASETQKNAVSSTKKELPQTPKTPRKAKSEDQ